MYLSSKIVSIIIILYQFSLTICSAKIGKPRKWKPYASQSGQSARSRLSAVMYEIHVLFEGYCRPIKGGVKADCSCTLIKGPKIIVVDTMTPWDGPRLVAAMARHGVRCEDVDFVVSTHGHSDHVGNNNLFLKAKHVVGRCVSHQDVYYDDEDTFVGDVYTIDEHVRIVPTPGHTLVDVSVVVRTANLGTVGIVGDLFEREDDLVDESVWLKAGSEDPDAQRRHRQAILEQVDWIVPGHGPMFSTEKYKK